MTSSPGCLAWKNPNPKNQDRKMAVGGLSLRESSKGVPDDAPLREPAEDDSTATTPPSYRKSRSVIKTETCPGKLFLKFRKLLRRSLLNFGRLFFDK